MFTQPGGAKSGISEPQWYKDTEKYGESNTKKSIIQLINTLIPYAIAWFCIVWMLNNAYPLWLVFATAVIASIFLVRIFVLFHDCTHRSLFKSHKANRFWGYILGMLTLTPYEKWQHSHNIHHNTFADLDKSGIGDITTITVKEYLNLPWRKRLFYRLYRNPFIMFIFGPVYIFLLDHRLTPKNSNKNIKFSVAFNNIALVTFIGILVYMKISYIYIWIYLFIAVLAGALGIWFFYVQHQFEGVYWSRHDEWDPFKAAFEGSSYYEIPKILQWLTANIGLHTIHHLRVSIPNYNLQSCYDEIPALHDIKKLSLRRSMKSLWLNLWDEEKKELVSFHSIRKKNQN
jgi:acyl-lipid omega-6 desaturase (Delta-12 desaturase)